MNDEESFPGDDPELDVDLPPDATEEALNKLVALQQQSQQQLDQAMQRIGDLQAQVGQAIVQAMHGVAQSNMHVADAMQRMCDQMAKPRKRVAVRDSEGRITEAHEMPMAS